MLIGARYRLLRRIGSGGMGVVWLARDEVLRRQVAVKELHHNLGGSDRTIAEGRERSLREARATAALHHPNIVAVYDVVEQDDRPWIVMEYVSGRSVKEIVVEDGPLPVDRTVRIGLQLHAAHAAGITHRDVKPANVLLTDGDVVRLTDFGLALLPDAEGLTETGAVMGTPGYLAPEQAAGHTPGPPADMFGVGATLYFAVEGVGPFARGDYMAMLGAYARHDIRPPQRAGDLAAVLMRLLSADPAKRPAVAAARDLLTAGAVRPARPSRRVLLVGAAAAAAAGVTAAATLWTVPDRKRSGRSAASPAKSGPARAAGLGPAAWHDDDIKDVTIVGSLALGIRPGDHVVALDAKTGVQRWRGPGGISDLKQVGKGMIAAILITSGGMIIDGATGARKSKTPGSDLRGGGDGVAVFRLGSEDLTAYDCATNKIKWQVPFGPEFDDPHLFSSAGLFCGCARGVQQDTQTWDFRGISIQTGATMWLARPQAVEQVHGSWADDSRLYVNVTQGGRENLLCIEARTGRQLWTITPTMGTKSAKIGVNDLVRLGDVVVMATTGFWEPSLSAEGLIAVAADSGAVRWRRSLVNPSVAVTSDGRLFAASYDSTLHELDPATGETAWSVSTPLPVDHLYAVPGMILATSRSRTTAYPLLGASPQPSPSTGR
ncbi:protein kinase domain-containing protein [Krasilnikovia sp. MM14-A1259]|uniref:serine/threonine-protein kinase n=1 Tax=Krasilnikovia sp. MM14-A1259 TaxID=3373539 RepID=UPI003803A1FE